VVRVTVRISTTLAQIAEVQRELQIAFANTNATSFLGCFRARGGNTTAAQIDSVTPSSVRCPSLLSLFQPSQQHSFRWRTALLLCACPALPRLPAHAVALGWFVQEQC
jgi:hypothetical protein